MSLLRRKIDVTVTLGTGDFGEGPAGSNNTVTLTGLRVQAEIVKTKLPSMDSASIRLFGVAPSFMNKITRLGKPILAIRNNTVTVSAGDDTNGMSQVFTGTIYSSFGDYDGMPEVGVSLTALNGTVDLTKPVPPLSFPTGADVGVVVSQIAASLGKPFLNHGVDVRLPTGSYFPGTALDQLRAVSLAANINSVVNGGVLGQTVEIWPKTGTRGGTAPTLSKDNGLIGYPRPSDSGISLTALYQPGFLIGENFNLQSDIPPACGLWHTYGLSYSLESEQPNGKWFMNIDATLPLERGGTLQV